MLPTPLMDRSSHWNHRLCCQHNRGHLSLQGWDQLNLSTLEKVEARNQPFLQPSKLIEIANTQSHQERPSAITIGEKDEAVWVDYFGEKGQTTIYLNPYDGKIIHTSHLGTDEFDFYRFILNGHLYMWFPRTIGKPLVSYGVLLSSWLSSQDWSSGCQSISRYIFWRNVSPFIVHSSGDDSYMIFIMYWVYTCSYR